MTKESKLSKYKLKYEDKKGKLKLSRTAGKPKPIIVQLFLVAKNATVEFFIDCYVAIKAIIRGIL